MRKPLHDPQVATVRVGRYHCEACRRTFRHYPAGVGPTDQSRRLVQLAALCWALGLSLRSVRGFKSWARPGAAFPLGHSLSEV